MSENSISEDLVPIIRQKRKQWWRLVLLVFSPVLLFWIVFGYQVYKVEAHYELGSMNFVPRCRVVLHKMLGDRFKYEPQLIDYGDWAPLATAKVRPGQVRTGARRAWQGFHEPAQPVPSLRLAPLKTRSVTPSSGGGLEFMFGNHDIPPGTADPFNAGLMLPISPTGEVTIPRAGTITILALSVGCPPKVKGMTSPREYFNSQGNPIPKPPDLAEIERWPGDSTEVGLDLQQGTAMLATKPNLRVFDRLTHAQFCYGGYTKPGALLEAKLQVSRNRLFLSRPTDLRIGMEFMACVQPPVEIPAKMGEILSNEVCEVEIAHTFTSKQQICAFSFGPSHTSILVRPSTPPPKSDYATFVLHTSHKLQIQVTAITNKNQALVELPEAVGCLHLCSFPVALTDIVSLRVHRLVSARCFVDIGPIDPFPGSTPGATDELEDVIPEFDLEGAWGYEALAQALGGLEGLCLNKHLSRLPAAHAKNQTIRQILQQYESDPAYRGDKIMIHQKQGWIWTGK